ncbi:MAG: hypothetical protein NTZ69_07840 [Bacteroidia bacterium]|nr:hypothetical protein [Bacteroidia bacterium]
MGLASEMKNLSEELLSSFKQRIRENEELVSDVQKTLDSFRKDHQEMAAVLNANAMNLRKDLATGEKERLNTYNGLMSDIHHTIASIQKEVVEIQTSTFNMINEFAADRTQMAAELNKFFSEGRAERMQDEKTRMKEFDALMNDINVDIKSINDEVSAIFKNTNEMLENFETEHLEMSAELRAELGQNLAIRVEYTRTLLHGFQKRLSEISKENQKTAQKLRKDLASGETTRLNNYKGLMKEIHTSIKGIRKEVKDIQKASIDMIGDYAQDRSQGAEAWNKMQETITQLRKTGVVKPAKEVVGKAEKKEVKIETPVEAVKGAIIKEESTITSLPIETPVDVQPKAEPKPEVPMTLEEKVLGYINRHPLGVKVSEMEEPLGETRMKIGFVAKALLEEGKVQKMDNIYFPFKI